MNASIPASVQQYALQIPIKAPRSRVWTALTRETDRWWLSSFRMTGPDATVSLNAEAGGLLIERRPNGASLLWYQVLMCEPGVALHMVGHLGPDWGGPATSMLKLTLEEAADGCVLHVADALVGVVGEATAASLKAGWTELFTTGLKRHVEAKLG